MASYRFLVQQLTGSFEGCEFHHVPRADNEAADTLAKIGSTRQAIAGLVLRGGAAWMAAGLAFGALGVVAVARLLRNLLYGVPPFDPIALGVSVVTLLVCATIALLVPVRRAARVDPIEDAAELAGAFRAFGRERPAAFLLVMAPAPGTPVARQEFRDAASTSVLRVAGRLALWGRRLVGEALTQAQRVAAERDALTALLAGGVDRPGLDLAAMGRLFARLTENHTQRMESLGLDA